jgi:hypothetical protein
MTAPLSRGREGERKYHFVLKAPCPSRVSEGTRRYSCLRRDTALFLSPKGHGVIKIICPSIPTVSRKRRHGGDIASEDTAETSNYLVKFCPSPVSDRTRLHLVLCPSPVSEGTRRYSCLRRNTASLRLLSPCPSRVSEGTRRYSCLRRDTASLKLSVPLSPPCLASEDTAETLQAKTRRRLQDCPPLSGERGGKKVSFCIEGLLG